MKNWLLEIIVKKGGASAVRAGILGLTGLMAAHSGLLSDMGIIYDSVKNTILIDLNAIQTWINVVGLTAVAGLAIKVANHHAGEAVKPKEG